MAALGFSEPRGDSESAPEPRLEEGFQGVGSLLDEGPDGELLGAPRLAVAALGAGPGQLDHFGDPLLRAGPPAHPLQ